jgi:hypothetical protein
MELRHMPATTLTLDALRAQIAEQLDGLREALSQRAEPRRICELSRAVSFLAGTALDFPEAWDQETVEAVVCLLEDSAEATRTTEYGQNCAGRPVEFRERVGAAILAATSLKAIGC